MAQHTHVDEIQTGFPPRRRKIVSRRGVHFTIMVVGDSGLGKTTFINALFSTKRLPWKDYTELIITNFEEQGLTLKFTVIKGDNHGAWNSLVEQESRSQRSEILDRRVHVCLYFIRLTGHAHAVTCLKQPSDAAIMQCLGTRVNLFPVIAKADNLSQAELSYASNWYVLLRRRRTVIDFGIQVRDIIAAKGIQVYQPPIETEDSERARHANLDSEATPPSINGPSKEDARTANGRLVEGGQYLWDVAEDTRLILGAENEQHYDCAKLHTLFLRSFMLDLISSTEVHYEVFRTVRLGVLRCGPPREYVESVSWLQGEERLRQHFTEQLEAREDWWHLLEQHIAKERHRLNRDYRRYEK
ncbi:Septin-domain-containing protein [Vararia minispora EC-137]|uniref:Septin-domain-containing protein n=1 Tax=Vararia minispora EC-137 TaxID=1314806 RepID=A0ACB8QKU1_9AGAM|nr:Septin-domain-containing protein [Vararia minispora EC-137]